MGFQPEKFLGSGKAERRREFRLDDRWILPWLEPGSRVMEIGSGTGRRGILLLHHDVKAVYVGLEPSPSLLESAQARLAKFGARARLEMIAPAYPLPLPERSQDACLSLDYLEYLRKDELYMACNEARRCVRAGGHWLIRSLSSWSPHPLAFLLYPVHFAHARVHERTALELQHFISPEDWKVVKCQRSVWTSRECLVLERLPG